jgi:AAA family ATP:ADP antiporter
MPSSEQQHDPFPMRSEEARRLAASVEQPTPTTDDCHDNDVDDGNDNIGVGMDGGTSPTWHKMSMTISQRLPKFLKMAGSSSSRRSYESSSRESLVAKTKKKTKQKMKKRTGGANEDDEEEESIYDRDNLDESRGIHNDNDDDDDDDNYNNNYDDDEEEDDYIESPSIRSRANRMLLRPQDVSDLPYPVGILLLKIQQSYFTTRSMAKSIHRHIYGNTWSWDDMVRTMVLSSTLFVMIGGYWLLRSLKDVVMTALCGVESIPKAKMLSVFVVLGIVAIYNHLLDSTYRKEQLFYIFGSFYLLLFTSIAILLEHPTIGLDNQMSNPNRLLGWVSYCGIESFGSVMVALFWSYANSSFNLKQAKRSYGVMVATAQLGSILGPSFVKTFGQKWGIPRCYMAGASCMLILQFTMWVYVTMFGTPPEEASSADTNKDATATTKESSSVIEKKKPKAGILEGIHLFVSHNYVKGIFAISCLYEIEVTIVVSSYL